MERDLHQIDSSERLSLRDLYIEKTRAIELKKKENLSPDEKLAGAIFNGVLDPSGDLTVNMTDNSVPQANRVDYENRKKEFSTTDSESIEKVEMFNNAASGKDNLTETLPLPEIRVAIGTVFLAYDSRTEKFYIVTRVNDDFRHNPVAGCVTGNYNMLQTGEKIPHPGEERMASFSNIIPFNETDEGDEYLWPYADNASSYSYDEYKKTILKLSGNQDIVRRLPAKTRLYKTISLPGGKNLSIESNSGKSRTEKNYSIYMGPTQTIECGKLAYIGDLAEISGFKNGQWGGNIIVEPVDGIMEKLDNLLSNNSKLLAQKNIDASQKIYDPVADTRIYSSDGRQMPENYLARETSLSLLYAPNIYGMLRVMHQLRDQGVSLTNYFKEVLARDYGVNL